MRAAQVDQLLTVQEAADLMHTSVRFVRRLIMERRIEFVKVGRHVRIRESALTAYVVAGTVAPMTTDYVTRSVA
jgi:excisionase family DNA binding protein